MPNDLESLQTHTPIKAQQSLTQATHTHTTIPKMIENPQTHHLIFTQKTQIIRPPKNDGYTYLHTPKNCIEIRTSIHKFLLEIRDFNSCFQCNFDVCVTSSV